MEVSPQGLHQALKLTEKEREMFGQLIGMGYDRPAVKRATQGKDDIMEALAELGLT